jgi:release factor glutamine methyltransferase
VAYILGEREFWSLPLEVGPGVLIPRPETELLVERALAHLPGNTSARVLDVATGSGAVALAIAHERPLDSVTGTDVSEGALGIARRNAERLGLARVDFRTGSWFAPVAGERFAVIVGNPPYVAAGDPRVARDVHRFEPHEALYSGPTGLEALQALVAGAPGHLAPGGWLVVEHGEAQGKVVRGLFERAGFTEVSTCRDLAGLDRCTEGRWPG